MNYFLVFQFLYRYFYVFIYFFILVVVGVFLSDEINVKPRRLTMISMNISDYFFVILRLEIENS